MEDKQGKYITLDCSVDLSGNEWIVYSFVAGFPSSAYQGSIEYLSQMCKVSRKTALNVLKSLVSRGYLVKEQISADGHWGCCYKVPECKNYTLESSECKNCTLETVSECKNCTLEDRQSVKIAPNNNIYNINNNIYNNNINNNTRVRAYAREEEKKVVDVVVDDTKKAKVTLMDLSDPDFASIKETTVTNWKNYKKRLYAIVKLIRQSRSWKEFLQRENITAEQEVVWGKKFIADREDDYEGQNEVSDMGFKVVLHRHMKNFFRKQKELPSKSPALQNKPNIETYI